MGSGDAVVQLAQQDLSAVTPFWGVGFFPAVQGEVPDDAAQPWAEQRGLGGGNGVPGFQIGVVDAFLRVTVAAEDVPGDAPQKIPVFVRRLVNGSLVPPPVQVDDVTVLQGLASFV